MPGTAANPPHAIRREGGLLDPRALALPDWETLLALADALVAASHDEYRGWGDVVIFAACTAARIGGSPAAASETSTPPSGSGPFAVRPHPPPAG
nr:hypothetical protein [Streptomyces sp. SID5594]